MDAATIKATSPGDDQGAAGSLGVGPVAPGGPVVVLTVVEAAERLGVSPRTVRRRATIVGSGVRQVARGRYILDDAA